jgi:hypothetical protein
MLQSLFFTSSLKYLSPKPSSLVNTKNCTAMIPPASLSRLSHPKSHNHTIFKFPRWNFIGVEQFQLGIGTILGLGLGGQEVPHTLRKFVKCRYASYLLNKKAGSSSYLGLESLISEPLSLLAFDEFSEGMWYLCTDEQEHDFYSPVELVWINEIWKDRGEHQSCRTHQFGFDPRPGSRGYTPVNCCQMRANAMLFGRVDWAAVSCATALP